MLTCTPFLLFDGNCAEAMSFYHQCLGGELTVTRLGDSPMKDQLPPEKHDRIINAHLKRGDFEISATDWMSAIRLDQCSDSWVVPAVEARQALAVLDRGRSN